MKTLWTIFTLISILAAHIFEFATAAANWYTANNGHRYLIEGDAKYNWLQAHDQCARRDLQLAFIENSSKNDALVALLRSVFGSSRDIWLGHHDEFNKKKDKNRSWYSATSGQSTYFGYWDSGEPNNKNGEHCTQIYRKASNFRWNDDNCDTKFFGYICEEHYLTTKYRKHMDGKRQTTNQKNNQLSTEFSKTQSQIQKINENTRRNTDNLLLLGQKSSEEAMDDLQKSLNELVLIKPYLVAVVADIGDVIRELAEETKAKMAIISEQTRKSIEDVHVNGEKSTNAATAEFAVKLTNNKNEVDKLLVY